MKIRLGVAGLGRAFSLMLPTLRAHPGVELVAAADPRLEARQRFEADFGTRTHDSIEALCDDSDVQAVYIATPHELHAAHACAAAARGKHILVEKPMAVTLAECRAMIEAAARSGVRVVVGHSHSFDAPVRRAREIVASGALGAVRMVSALNYTDFLYRPRRPEELVTSKGGGVLFSQAAHQVDVVRLLAGGRVVRVRASAGAWDPARPTEGAYGAHLVFDDGTFATLTYSGYAHFDSDEFCAGIGELGQRKDADYGAARRALAAAANADESEVKNARNYGGANATTLPDPVGHQHFGLVIVSCERGDIRPTPAGVLIYADSGMRFEALAPPRVPRTEVIDEFLLAIETGRPTAHDGEWAMATLQVCIAMLQSARENREVTLS